MLDFVIEQIAFERIIAAVAVIVSLAFIRSYAGGVKNDHRRDLHQRTIILAGLPSSVLTCTLPTLAETGAIIIILHPRPLELVAIINAIRLRFTDAEIFAEKCDLNDVESVKEFSDNWNKSERTPTGPSNTIESGQIRRIDGVIFSTDYEDGVVITPKQEKRDAAAHLLLLSLIPAIAHSPNSRDIRVIRLVQPFYTAGTLKVVNSKITNINLAGIQALRGIALSRYLQSEIDSAKSQNVVPEVDKTRIEKSNVSCLTVCPGFVREATVWPLFSQYGIIGKLLYFLLLPVIYLITKSASEGSEVITYALMKEKPGKGMLYRDNKLVGLPKELQIELSNIDNLKSTWMHFESKLKNK